MLTSKWSETLAPGDRVALPFGKYATVADAKVGTKFVTVTWEEPYQPSRYEIHTEVMIES